MQWNTTNAKECDDTKVCGRRTDVLFNDAEAGNRLSGCIAFILHFERIIHVEVTIRASLPERGIYGSNSAAVEFRTNPCQPDPPSMPKLIMRQANLVIFATI